jgi:hypothetical protein
LHCSYSNFLRSQLIKTSIAPASNGKTEAE